MTEGWLKRVCLNCFTVIAELAAAVFLTCSNSQFDACRPVWDW